MNKTTILIADDHPLFREGVRAEIEKDARFDIIAETGDGESAFDLIVSKKPDVAILDFQMPKLNALEIMHRIGKTGTRFVLLTMHKDRKIFYHALDAGVTGYVLKDDANKDIIKAVEYAMVGRNFISDSLTNLLIDKVQNNSKENRIKSILETLTPMEKKTLLLIAGLKSNAEIADTLFITKRTVENYKSIITGKLNLQSSRALLKFALENKELIEEDSQAIS